MCKQDGAAIQLNNRESTAYRNVVLTNYATPPQRYHVRHLVALIENELLSHPLKYPNGIHIIDVNGDLLETRT